MKSSKREIKKIKDLLKIEDPNWHVIKLPRDFYVFFSKKKDLSPYDSLYEWIFERIERYPWLTVSDVFLMEDDAKKLDLVVEDWLKKVHRLSGKKLHTTIAFTSLERGPASFSKLDPIYPVVESTDPTPLKKGFVYIRKNEIK